MTRTYETREVTTSYLRGIKCDVCGIENTNYKYDDPRIQLEAQVEVHSSNGSSIETVFDVDFCSKCFRDKIIPFLQKIGVDTDAAGDWFLLPEM